LENFLIYLKKVNETEGTVLTLMMQKTTSRATPPFFIANRPTIQLTENRVMMMSVISSWSVETRGSPEELSDDRLIVIEMRMKRTKETSDVRQTKPRKQV